MSVDNKLLENKDSIQNFLNNLNCDSEKWFVFNTADGRNPTLRNFSNRMSYRIMNNNTETVSYTHLTLPTICSV